ncbi:sensor domain-containing diguanylate cyclase [Aromatoleum evansii]|uniref:sensor domain-containing diguanylate cyclase n=1 Tax=Aromatoleum evansii TaxID=59406 RepID=UPI00145F1298|nr:sensor domain-containing diguanylate cyclase [Aromatoleum evansii]NMG31624.1 diguanylate cyclase [Aromatoleum evansii]
MLAAPIPFDEPERIASLRRMQLLSTPDEEVFDRVTRTAQRVFDTPIVLVSLIDSARQWFKSCIGLPVRETPREISFCGHAINGDHLLVVSDAAADWRFADNPLVTGEPSIRFYAGRPLRNAEGHAVGTLCVIDRKPRDFTTADRVVLDDLGAWVEAVFLARELSETQRKMLHELDAATAASRIDPLLNIWNRGAIMEALANEMQRAERSRSDLSMLMIDFDHFKSINDRYGHPGGDAVLVEGCRRIRGALRSYDSLGRYGGEEFMVLLPDIGRDAAVAVARRVRQAVAGAAVCCAAGEIAATVSIGVAHSEAASRRTIAELVASADKALYRAKANGRDRVELGG